MRPSRNEAFFAEIPHQCVCSNVLPALFSPCLPPSVLLHASGPVLMSTRLYIAGLCPGSCRLCVTGKVSSGRPTLNTQLCLGERRERDWEKEREKKKAPLTGGQTPVHHCPPLSPLSPSARRQKTTGIWREGGWRAKESGLCLGRLASDPG